MSLYRQAIFLFLLNITDAFLTVYWVRHGYATEGNHLMATLLELGNLPFLAVKFAIGLVAAYSFWNWKEFRLARFGLATALVMYSGVMGVHLLTGLAVAGYLSSSTIHQFTAWSKAILILVR